MNSILSHRIGPAPHLSVDYAGQGELVVLLHGIGGNKRNWRDCVPALADHFQVVAWDARGWGESDDYEGPLTFDDMADDLARVIDHFGAKRAHVIGLSMGGRIAMQFAERHKTRVASLVLCDTSRGITGWSDERKDTFLRSRQEPLLNGQEVADIAEPLSRTLVSTGATPDAMEQVVDSIRRLHKDSYLKAIKVNLLTPPHEYLGEIMVPTLVIVGELDRLAPPADARAIADAIPDATLLILPNAGHLVNIEAPEQFNSAVLGFLLAQRGRCRDLDGAARSSSVEGSR